MVNNIPFSEKFQLPARHEISLKKITSSFNFLNEFILGIFYSYNRSCKIFQKEKPRFSKEYPTFVYTRIIHHQHSNFVRRFVSYLLSKINIYHPYNPFQSPFHLFHPESIALPTRFNKRVSLNHPPEMYKEPTPLHKSFSTRKIDLVLTHQRYPSPCVHTSHELSSLPSGLAPISRMATRNYHPLRFFLYHPFPTKNFSAFYLVM